MIQKDHSAYESRSDIAATLSAAGYSISPATLAGLATRGGGPPYDIFNGRARYQVESTLQWARDRVTLPRRRTEAHIEPARAA